MTDLDLDENDIVQQTKQAKETSNDEDIWYQESSATEFVDQGRPKNEQLESNDEDEDFVSEDERDREEPNLSVVDEELQSIPSTYEPSVTSEPPYKFSCTHNFDAMLRDTSTNRALMDKSEKLFLRIRHLRKEYEVHYIEKANSDLHNSEEILLKQRCLSLHTVQNKRRATYLTIALKRRAFVFNLKKLKDNKQFVLMIKSLLENQKILKIVLEAETTINPLLRTLGLSLLNFGNVVDLKQSIYLTNTPEKMNLSNLAKRVYGKSIDTVFEKWISKAEFLGPDDCHYVGVSALSIFCLFFKFGSILKTEINYFSNIVEQTKSLKSPKFLLDMMCLNSLELFKQNNLNFLEATESMSYSEIVKKCNDEKMILVTSDKYLISKGNIERVMVYRGRRLFRQGLSKIIKLQM